ncbi:MAG: flavin reductase [Acutalibacteraceae bacterium]
MNFVEINPKKENFINPFYEIGTDWMLISAGDKEKFNTMTASWGGLGILWNKNVSFAFVRPQRYTFEFLEKYDYYSLSFFDSSFKPVLKFCGEVSGRNTNKVKESGLTPVVDNEAPYFKEAKKVFICKKIYSQFIDSSCFIDKNIQNNYENKDYHKMYVGEIVRYKVKK